MDALAMLKACLIACRRRRRRRCAAAVVAAQPPSSPPSPLPLACRCCRRTAASPATDRRLPLLQVLETPLDYAAALPLADDLFTFHFNLRTADGPLADVPLHGTLRFKESFPATGPTVALYHALPHPNVQPNAQLLGCVPGAPLRALTPRPALAAARLMPPACLRPASPRAVSWAQSLTRWRG
jgi:hypothetical protein